MKRTKSHVDLDLYAALFKDIAAWDSNLRQDLDADYRRLCRTVDSRGVSFTMIDMPDACKRLDASLSAGTLSACQLPNTFGKVVDGGTREFLSCLFQRVFDGSGYLYPDVDPTAIFFLRQVLLLSKKVKENCDDITISRAAEEFRKVDEGLRAPTLDWECDTLDLEQGAARLTFASPETQGLDPQAPLPLLQSGDRITAPVPLLRKLDEVCGIVISQFPELDWREITPRHGPGAVADLRTGTDKYLLINWPKKLEDTFPFAYCGQSREDLHLEVGDPTVNHEPPARLLAVPKVLKAPRLIASEPTAHQFLQQGLMAWIRKNLPYSLKPCIDFLSQKPSREFCLRASRTEEFATVDLSSASDRLSCWTVERALASSPSLLRALHSCRTRWLVNATGHGEEFFIKLKKFAAQGSAVTFPVQSIVYACMAIACVLYEKGWIANSTNIRRVSEKLIRVFGDDIIMPSYAVLSLHVLMGHCDLKVNASKTHYKGLFRESCGVDAYDGVDITPLYLRSLTLGSSSEDIVSWIDVINNAYQTGLWHVSDAMIQKIPSGIRKLIPISNGALGVLTLRSFQSISPIGKIRDSRYLHRAEILGLAPSVKTVKRSRETHHSLLQYFLERPRPDTNWRSGYMVRTRLLLRKRWVSTESRVEIG